MGSGSPPKCTQEASYWTYENHYKVFVCSLDPNPSVKSLGTFLFSCSWVPILGVKPLDPIEDSFFKNSALLSNGNAQNKVYFIELKLDPRW